MRLNTRTVVLVVIFGALSLLQVPAQIIRQGVAIPGDLRTCYENGAKWLVTSQDASGGWSNNAGITGICLMALLASGEDPNFGPYAKSVRSAIRYIIRQQDARTGFIRTGMYEHGFAMLALADCYGAVDDRLLWTGKKKRRSVAASLELAIRCAVTSQANNPFGAWRYSPSGHAADTSAAGAVLMGLLGARNAGLEVPDTSIDSALSYFDTMTMKDGSVGYAGSFGLGSSGARSAITSLVFAVAKRRDHKAYLATRSYVVDHAEESGTDWPCYWRYYTSQALFQVDHELWKRWNQENTRWIMGIQEKDGSIPVPGASNGRAYATGMALLSSALTWCYLPVYER